MLASFFQETQRLITALVTKLRYKSDNNSANSTQRTTIKAQCSG